MLSAAQHNFVLTFVILIYLFTPTQFTPIVALALLLSLLIRTGINAEKQIIIAGVFSIFLISFIAQIFYFDGKTGKIVTDFYRWFVISACIFLLCYRHNKAFLNAFVVFFVASFVFSILQKIIPLNPLIFNITSIYAYEQVLESVFVPGFVRVTGFNEGPGHVGLVALVACIVAPFFFNKEYKHYKLLVSGTYIASFLLIVMAAAKGALIAWILYILFFASLRFRIIAISIVILFYLIFKFFNEESLEIVLRLFNIASAEARVDIWATIVTEVMHSTFTMIIGHGRIGALDGISVLDSDIVFVFLVNGVLGVILFFALILYMSYKIHGVSVRMIALSMVVIVAGSSNPFLADIKFGLIYFSVLVAIGLKVSHESSNRNRGSWKAIFD